MMSRWASCAALLPAVVALAGCPEWPGKPRCAGLTCTTRASHGRFYLDPAAQGAGARVWVLTHQVALPQGKRSYPLVALPKHRKGPRGETPLEEGGDYESTGREPYLPVHIGHDPKSAGWGVRALELEIRVNTQAVVVVTDDRQLPLRIANGEVVASRSDPPTDGISPTRVPLAPVDWWGPRKAPPARLWYTARHVKGRIYLVRTGDPPEGEVYRMMGSVAALFERGGLTGCHPASYRFKKID